MRVCRRALLVLAFQGTVAFAQPAQPPWIFAMHDPGAEGEIEAKGKRGWIVFTEEIGEDPNNGNGKDFRPWSDRGHGVIVRLNHGYGSAGTLPYESQYGNFARRVANFIQASPGADIWILGNETNLPREWPGNVNGDANTGEAITPQRYVNCYSQVHDELRRRGLTNEILVPAPAGTWAPPFDGSLPPFPNRGVPGFLDYWAQVMSALGPDRVAGLAIHAYTHGGQGVSPIDPALVFSDEKMGPPYQHVYLHFRVYRNYMGAIPSSMRSLPVWITEANELREMPGYNWDPDANTIQWIENAYAEIHNWNSNGSNQKIRAVALFRWPDVWEEDRNYCISCVGAAVEGFRRALDHDYRWTDNAAGNNASFLRAESVVPASIRAGETAEVTIRLQNTGSTSWSGGELYRLGAASTNQLLFEGFPCGGYSPEPTNARVFLCPGEVVAPGQSYTFRFRIRPTASSGTQLLALRMVRDGVEWFGATESWSIAIDNAPACGKADFPAPSDRWKLETWNNRDMAGEPVERRTDFPGNAGFEKNWGDGGPSSCAGNDNFSIRFSRRFYVDTMGVHRFTTTTDDGVRLFVDGRLIIDQWRDQAPTAHSGTDSLAAGWHDLRMDYYENGGGAFAKVEWRRESAICGTADFPAPSDRWKLETWNNRDMAGEPVERRTDFPGNAGFEKNWGDGGPSSCAGNDNFSIRFSRRFYVDTMGVHRFTTTTDDGVRLFVDGRLIIDQWRDQAPTAYSGTDSLAAGWHDLRMDYYENGGGAFAKIEWRWESGPPLGNHASFLRAESVVPASIRAGETAEVMIRVQNTGSTSWSGGELYRLGAASTNQLLFEGFPCGGYSSEPTNARVFLCPGEVVAPGQSYTFRFRIRPTASSGTQLLALRMVRDGVEWFGATESWSLQVGTAGGSRLGVHIVLGARNGYGDFLGKIRDAGRVLAAVHCVSDFGGCAEAKQYNQRTVTVGRLQQYEHLVNPRNDAVRNAEEFYTIVRSEWLAHPFIDYWEAQNEINSDYDWQRRFYFKLMELAEADGFKLALFSSSTGTPPRPVDDGGAAYSAIKETCLRARPGGHILSLHEYGGVGVAIETLKGTEPYHALRYRTLYDYLKQYDAIVPLVITECAQNGGYQYPGLETFMKDFEWYDSELMNDDYVLGATIFTLGNWAGANFQEALPALGDYIASR